MGRREGDYIKYTSGREGGEGPGRGAGLDDVERVQGDDAGAHGEDQLGERGGGGVGGRVEEELPARDGGGAPQGLVQHAAAPAAPQPARALVAPDAAPGDARRAPLGAHGVAVVVHLLDLGRGGRVLAGEGGRRRRPARPPVAAALGCGGFCFECPAFGREFTFGAGRASTSRYCQRVLSMANGCEKENRGPAEASRSSIMHRVCVRKSSFCAIL